MHAYLEGGRIRYADGQVCKDSERFVRVDAFEGKVVSDLMNGQEKVVVCGPADHVREEQEPKRERMRVSQLHGDKDLQGHDGKDNVFSKRFMAHELDNVGVGLHDGHSARAVRLLGHQPEEIGGVLRRSRVWLAIGVYSGRRDDGASGGTFTL